MQAIQILHQNDFPRLFLLIFRLTEDLTQLLGLIHLAISLFICSFSCISLCADIVLHNLFCITYTFFKKLPC